MNNFTSTNGTRRIPLGETNANQLSLSQTGNFVQKPSVAASVVTEKDFYLAHKDKWGHKKEKSAEDLESNSGDLKHGLENSPEDTEVDLIDDAVLQGDKPLHNAQESLQKNRNLQDDHNQDPSLIENGGAGWDKNGLVQITPKDSLTSRNQLLESLKKRVRDNAHTSADGVRRKLTTTEFLRKKSGKNGADPSIAEYQGETHSLQLENPVYHAKNKHIATPITKSRRSIGGASLVNPMFTKILPIQSTVQNIGGKPTLTTVSDKETTNGELKKVTAVKNTTSGNTTALRGVSATGASNASGSAKNSTAMNLKVWQTNWRNIMKRETVIYFDIQETVTLGGAQDLKEKEAAKALLTIETLKLGYYSLGAAVSKFFDREVTIVITKTCLKATS